MTSRPRRDSSGAVSECHAIGTVDPMQDDGWLSRARMAARLDLTPTAPPPAAGRVLVATLVALGASLGANALLVLAGTSIWAADKGYSHFQLWDYGTLTALGVVAAGASWPLVARASSSAHWLFLRLAIIVSLVLLLPDVWLLAEGQSGRAVVVLVAMHVVVALITYNLLVRTAPVRPGPPGASAVWVGDPRGGVARGPVGDRDGGVAAPAYGAPVPAPTGWRRQIWIWMSVLSGVTGLLGIAAIVAVPVNRKDAWVPASGRDVYLAHAAAGGILGIAAVALLVALLRADRVSLYSALAGLVTAGMGAVGGVLTVYSSVRYEGLALMLLGALVAPFAYLAPIAMATAEAEIPSNRDWQDASAEDALACKRCGSVTAVREAAGLDEAAWADDHISARRCPLCPTRQLEAYKDVWICWCCETVYRRGPEAGVAWVVTPGARVGRG
jgi:hypothetical protein